MKGKELRSTETESGPAIRSGALSRTTDGEKVRQWLPSRGFSSIPLIFVVAICSLLLTVPAEAQTSVRPGIRGGLSLATNWGDTARPVEGWRAGLVSGVFLSFSFPDRPGLQLELNYIQRGARVQGTATSEDVAVRRLNYIETSVLGRFQLYQPDTVAPTPHAAHGLSVLVGPTFGIQTHSNFEAELRSNRTDYGLVIGTNYRIGLDGRIVKSLVLDIRYRVGVARIEEQAAVIVGGDGFDPNREGTFRNQGIVVTTGFEF